MRTNITHDSCLCPHGLMVNVLFWNHLLSNPSTNLADFSIYTPLVALHDLFRYYLSRNDCFTLPSNYSMRASHLFSVYSLNESVSRKFPGMRWALHWSRFIHCFMYLCFSQVRKLLSWKIKLLPVNQKHVCLFPWRLRKLTNPKIGYKEADSSNNIAHTILLPAAAAHPTHSPPPSPPPLPPSVQHHYQHKGRRIHCIFKPFSDHARLGDESKQGTYSINPWALCILTLHRVREGEENLKPSVYYSLVSPAVYSVAAPARKTAH